MSKYLIAILLTTIPATAAKKEHDWKTAKVLDARAVKTRFGVADTAAAIPTIRDTQLMLLTDEFGYVIEDSRVSGAASGGLIGITARAVSNRHHGCRFVVNDSVKFYQEKAFLHVVDADGKECKAEVLRQERLTKP